MDTDKTIKIFEEVAAELERAESKFGSYNSSHEGYAVILEELDELWDVVKLNPKKIELPKEVSNSIWGKFETEDEKKIRMQRIKDWQIKQRNAMMRAEAIQVACTAIRFIKDVCADE